MPEFTKIAELGGVVFISLALIKLIGNDMRHISELLKEIKTILNERLKK